jgi:hypothetical protein
MARKKNKDLGGMPILSHMTSIPIRSLLISVLALFGLLLQAGVSRGAEERTVTSGTWGGEHVSLEVSKSGAEVEFDCAHGQITQPLILDKHGNFNVAGTFTPEHGGPVRRDEETTPAQARYSGHVDGDSLSLKITLEKEIVGRYTLTRGSQALLRKCR